MSQSNIGSLFFDAIKALLIAGLKLLVLSISFSLKIIGIMCTQLSEAIQKIIIKRS